MANKFVYSEDSDYKDFDRENMGTTLDDSLYDDDNNKRPKLVIVIGVILLFVIILICLISCGKKEKSSNNYLESINVTGGEFSPKFDKKTFEYDVFTEKEIVTVSCTPQDSKSKTEGCNKRVAIENSCTSHEIVVTAQNKEKKTYKLNICNQSKNAPIIKEIKLNPQGFSKDKVIVTVIAEPQNGNTIAEEGYSFDGGNTWQKNNSYEVKENGLLEIKVRDSANNISTTYTEDIDSIDKTKLSVKINGSIPSGTETSSNVILTATVDPSETLSGIKYQWYKNNNKINDAKSDNYTATSSGTYKLIVTTGAGISTESNSWKVVKLGSGSSNVSITSIKQEPNTWTSGNIKIIISAKSPNGLHSKAYSFDGGNTWTNENNKSFSSNQTVKIVVRDAKGNKTQASSIVINKIDKTSPSVTISGSNTVGSELTATLNPKTTPSGYKYQWYFNDKVIDKATSNKYKATKEGKYTVKVTTGAGLSKISTAKQIVNSVAPSSEITSSVPNNGTISTSATLNVKTYNGTAKSCKWYKGSTALSSTSCSITVKEGGSYKVLVTYTTGESSYAKNIYVLNSKDTQGPTITIDARLDSYTGSKYTSGTWTNKDVYITVTATDSSGMFDLDFQYLPNDNNWYGHETLAWTSKTISGTNGKATIKFNANRNYDFTVRAKDKLGNITTKAINVKIDKSKPYTPIINDLDCFTNFKLNDVSGKLEIEITGNEKSTTSKTLTEDILCMGANSNFGTQYKDQYESGVSYCEARYPYSGGNFLYTTWTKLADKGISSKAKTANYYMFGYRCYDNAGNVSNALYVISSF